MTESQARALYQMGEEAVVAFLLHISRRLQALEEQSAKNSGNSSKPPSSDGLSKPTLKPMPQSLRKKTGKKPGGQKGHPGKTLEQSDSPDDLVPVSRTLR
jgi:transposase